MKVQTSLLYMSVAALLTFGPVHTGFASSFSVEPVRVILDLQHRTERMTVKNESDRPLTVLIKAYRWTQADAGKDHYAETDDLIIFPRALTMAPGEERFVRVGMAAPSGQMEQAFRIYMEEQPINGEQAPKAATARILMRLGIPVFAQPLKPEMNLKVHELILSKGLLQHTLTNSGNTFVTAEQITINGRDKKGNELFASNLGGAYLLAGSTRTFEIAIPKSQCSRITQINVTTRSKGKDQLSKLDMTSGACENK